MHSNRISRTFLAILFTVVTQVAWAAKGPINIALMPFQVKGVDSVYAIALGEKVKGELTSSGSYRVLERTRMDELLKEQGFQQSGACDASGCLVEAGRLLGVDQMLNGTLSKAGNTFIASLSIVDVGTGQVTVSVDATVAASSDSLFLLAPKALVHKLRMATDSSYAQATTLALKNAAEEAKAKALAEQNATSKTRRIIAWSLAGVSLVSAGSAAYFHLDSKKKFDQADVFLAQYHAATTTSASISAHDASKDQLNKGNRSQDLRNVAAVISLASLGFSLKFFF